MPIVWYYIWLSAKARSFFFFNAANPYIKNGGFMMESKWEIHQQLPIAHTPITFFVQTSLPEEEVLQLALRIGFPLIAKPDIGGRGRGVAILSNQEMLFDYHRKCPVHYLLQTIIPHELEVGIFYVRCPKTDRGFISGIVEKQMLSVTGDGISSIESLLNQSNRMRVYKENILINIGAACNDILPAGVSKVLVPIGNHARGATFFDITTKNNPALEKAMDALCRNLPEFHYGRLDIRYKSWDDLCAGKNFMLAEVNGAGSEPTHMYDPSNSLWEGWRQIIRHWQWLYAISKANQKRGFPYLTFDAGKKMFTDAKAYDAVLDAFHF
jgi:hypothetical protein